MGIINSKIVEDRMQAHGRRRIREVHTDHLGREHSFSYEADPKADVDDIMFGRVIQIEFQLVDREIQEVWKRLSKESLLKSLNLQGGMK